MFAVWGESPKAKAKVKAQEEHIFYFARQPAVEIASTLSCIGVAVYRVVGQVKAYPRGLFVTLMDPFPIASELSFHPGHIPLARCQCKGEDTATNPA